MKGVLRMKKFRCQVCDYVYDPEAGDPESTVKPRTAFEDLPDSWRCPVCDVAIDEFDAEGAAEPAPKGATREYVRPGLTIIWQSALCNHNGNCTRSLPGVFDLERRPWVDVHGADVDDIRRVIDECPTGALSYRTDDGDASKK